VSAEWVVKSAGRGGKRLVPIDSGWRPSWAFGKVFRRRVELEVGFSVEEEMGFSKERKGGALAVVGSMVGGVRVASA